MCSLFGFVDYSQKLTRKQRSKLLSTLSTACEERGTDATGIAYNVGGKLHIFKCPIPAHLMWYRVPREAAVVMGHTRMATQGSAKRGQNNHPFPGTAGDSRFALAHNGVLFNDKSLRKKYKLPATNVETDSYIAVQLLERFGKLNFDALQFMAEELEGSFTITALTDRDELYFVKGNNPLAIHHYPQYGLYIYASTEEILMKGVIHSGLRLGKKESVRIYTGEILRIDSHGKISRSGFDDEKLYFGYGCHWFDWSESPSRPYALEEDAYIQDLKAVASCCGVYPEDIDALLADGVSVEEIEEYLYCG